MDLAFSEALEKHPQADASRGVHLFDGNRFCMAEVSHRTCVVGNGPGHATPEKPGWCCRREVWHFASGKVVEVLARCATIASTIASNFDLGAM